jgi:hypothetical protein
MSNRRLQIRAAEKDEVNGLYVEAGLHEGVPVFQNEDGTTFVRIRWESPYHDYDRLQDKTEQSKNKDNHKGSDRDEDKNDDRANHKIRQEKSTRFPMCVQLFVTWLSYLLTFRWQWNIIKASEPYTLFYVANQGQPKPPNGVKA